MMDNILSEVRLEEMSRQTVSACRESRLDRNLTDKSRSADASLPRKSRSDTSQGQRSRSRSKNDSRSRSSTRSRVNSSETKAKSLETQQSEPVNELSRNLGELLLGDSSTSQSGGERPNIFLSTGTQRGEGVTATSHPASQPPSHPASSSHLASSHPTQPPGDSISLKQSMRPFLPSSPDQSSDEVEGAMGEQHPNGDRQFARDDTIFENEVWPRDGSPGSDVSGESDEILYGLQQQDAQLQSLASENEQLRKELAHEQQSRKRDHDDVEALLLDRESEVDSLRQRLQVAESEKNAGKRSNEIIASKLEIISDLRKQVARLERALAESEEQAVTFKKQFEMERASKLEEIAALKEEAEVLIRASKDKDLRCQSLKQRLGKLKRESSTVLGSMKRTSSTLSLRGSEASNDRVLMLGDDDCITAEGDGEGEIVRPELSKNDMHKRLAAAKWPERKIFHSFDEFIAALRSQAKTLYEQGIDYAEIAFNLNTALMSSELASDYAAHKKHIRSLTVDNILNAVAACDKASTLFTNSEKFSLICRGANESLFSLMRRLESGFIDYKIGDPKDLKAKLRVIKKRFCEAANLPQSIQQSIRHCNDLDDVVVCANEDLAKIEKEKQEFQNQSMPASSGQNFNQQRQFGQKNHGGFKQNYQSRPQWQQQQQQQQPQRQQQQYRPLMQQNPRQQQQQGGEINAMAPQRVYTSPDPSLPRAPTDFERQRENKEILICLRCRIMGSHSWKNCEFFKYCSMCACEGHTDFEHRKVAQGQSAAASRDRPQQQQQQQLAQPQIQPQQMQPQQARPQMIQPQQAQPQMVQQQHLQQQQAGQQQVQQQQPQMPQQQAQR